MQYHSIWVWYCQEHSCSMCTCTAGVKTADDWLSLSLFFGFPCPSACSAWCLVHRVETLFVKPYVLGYILLCMYLGIYRLLKDAQTDRHTHTDDGRQPDKQQRATCRDDRDVVNVNCYQVVSTGADVDCPFWSYSFYGALNGLQGVRIVLYQWKTVKLE